MTDSLFRNRTPEGAARQLAVVLKSATEMHLATLEGLQMRKSTSKYELTRQKSICETLVQQCIELDVPIGVKGLRGVPCARLDELLKAEGA